MLNGVAKEFHGIVMRTTPSVRVLEITPNLEYVVNVHIFHVDDGRVKAGLWLFFSIFLHKVKLHFFYGILVFFHALSVDCVRLVKELSLFPKRIPPHSSKTPANSREPRALDELADGNNEIANEGELVHKLGNL